MIVKTTTIGYQWLTVIQYALCTSLPRRARHSSLMQRDDSSALSRALIEHWDLEGQRSICPKYHYSNNSIAAMTTPSI